MTPSAPTGSQKASSARSQRAKKPEASVEVSQETRGLSGVKKLLSDGRRKGYLTLDDVNGALPGELVGAEQLEEVLALFGEHDIAIVESEPRERPRAAAEPARKSEDSGGAAADPVRVYLREMGQVSLLDRQGEVVIAKRIEAGEHRKFWATVGTPYGIREVTRLIDRLRRHKEELKHLLDGLDEEEPVHSPEERRRQLLLAASRIRRLEAEAVTAKAVIVNARTSEVTRARRQQEVAGLYQQMVTELLAVRFSKARLAEAIGTCVALHGELAALLQQGRSVARRFRLRRSEFEDLALLSTRRSKRGRDALAQLGGNPEQVARAVRALSEIESRIRKLESETGMGRDEIRAAQRSFSRASEETHAAKCSSLPSR